MNSDSQARMRVAALIYLMVNAVVFGVGLISVLMTPTLVQHGFFWIPAIIVTSLVLSAPLSWFIAPSMMMRFIRPAGFTNHCLPWAEDHWQSFGGQRAIAGATPRSSL
jgi:hypothetical protein